MQLHLDRIDHYYKRKVRTLLEILKDLRSRIGFFSLYKMGEQVEVNKINREADYKKIEEICDRIDGLDQIVYDSMPDR